MKVDNHNCDIVFLPRQSPITRPHKHFFQQKIDELLPAFPWEVPHRPMTQTIRSETFEAGDRVGGKPICFCETVLPLLDQSSATLFLCVPIPGMRSGVELVSRCCTSSSSASSPCPRRCSATTQPAR